MLKQASVADLRAGRVTRDDGYLVVTMRYYPRFLRRDRRDEYLRVMSPEGELLDEMLALKRRMGDHNLGWARSGFDRLFKISEEGWSELQRLVDLSRKRDVYLVCSCGEGQKCHRELLLILADRFLGAQIAPLRCEYAEFERRLDRLERPPIARPLRPGLKKGKFVRRASDSSEDSYKDRQLRSVRRSSSARKSGTG
jgi:uncharacterized protein YeaO (DUF488 family)